MKKLIYTGCLIILISSFFLCKTLAAEPSNNNLTTITVDASDNESSNLMYAIDSDDPNAFGSSNEFVVEAGTSHTVYVKDEAGNISGQVITAPIEKVGIEVTIGQDGTDSAISSTTAGRTTNAKAAVESGGGTINEKTITDGSSSSEKIFYTITTPSENVFYMVIDNTRSSDNVYLLNQVTEEDLLSLVAGGDAKESKKIPLFNDSSESDEAEKTEEKEKNNIAEKKENSNLPIIIIFAVIMAAIYYYIKIYKPKKAAEIDMMNAMDIDEFEPEEEFEDEDDMFEDDELKEEMLKKIMKEDIEEEIIEDIQNEEEQGGKEDVKKVIG